jgi:hypothetical protein
MTLEQATEHASAAAAAGDQNALDQALRARAGAIAVLAGASPTPELAAYLASAIDAGKVLDRDLVSWKARIGFERARLERLQAGFAAGFGFSQDPHVDYRG